MLQRGFNGVGVTVAINQAQWEGSGNCGKCIKVRFLRRREGGRERRHVDRWRGAFDLYFDISCPYYFFTTLLSP